MRSQSKQIIYLFHKWIKKKLFSEVCVVWKGGRIRQIETKNNSKKLCSAPLKLIDEGSIFKRFMSQARLYSYMWETASKTFHLITLYMLIFWFSERFLKELEFASVLRN